MLLFVSERATVAYTHRGVEFRHDPHAAAARILNELGDDLVCVYVVLGVSTLRGQAWECLRLVREGVAVNDMPAARRRQVTAA